MEQQWCFLFKPSSLIEPISSSPGNPYCCCSAVFPDSGYSFYSFSARSSGSRYKPTLPTEVLLGYDQVVPQGVDDFSADLLTTLRKTYKDFRERQKGQRDKQKLYYDRTHENVECSRNVCVDVATPSAIRVVRETTQ